MLPTILQQLRIPSRDAITAIPHWALNIENEQTGAPYDFPRLPQLTTTHLYSQQNILDDPSLDQLITHERAFMGLYFPQSNSLKFDYKNLQRTDGSLSSPSDEKSQCGENIGGLNQIDSFEKLPNEMLLVPEAIDVDTMLHNASSHYNINVKTLSTQHQPLSSVSNMPPTPTPTHKPTLSSSLVHASSLPLLNPTPAFELSLQQTAIGAYAFMKDRDIVINPQIPISPSLPTHLLPSQKFITSPLGDVFTPTSPTNEQVPGKGSNVLDNNHQGPNQPHSTTVVPKQFSTLDTNLNNPLYWSSLNHIQITQLISHFLPSTFLFEPNQQNNVQNVHKYFLRSHNSYINDNNYSLLSPNYDSGIPTTATVPNRLLFARAFDKYNTLSLSRIKRPRIQGKIDHSAMFAHALYNNQQQTHLQLTMSPSRRQNSSMDEIDLTEELIIPNFENQSQQSNTQTLPPVSTKSIPKKSSKVKQEFMQPFVNKGHNTAHYSSQQKRLQLQHLMQLHQRQQLESGINSTHNHTIHTKTTQIDSSTPKKLVFGLEKPVRFISPSSLTTFVPTRIIEPISTSRGQFSLKDTTPDDDLDIYALPINNSNSNSITPQNPIPQTSLKTSPSQSPSNNKTHINITGDNNGKKQVLKPHPHGLNYFIRYDEDTYLRTYALMIAIPQVIKIHDRYLSQLQIMFDVHLSPLISMRKNFQKQYQHLNMIHSTTPRSSTFQTLCSDFHNASLEQFSAIQLTIANLKYQIASQLQSHINNLFTKEYLSIQQVIYERCVGQNRIHAEYNFNQACLLLNEPVSQTHPYQSVDPWIQARFQQLSLGKLILESSYSRFHQFFIETTTSKNDIMLTNHNLYSDTSGCAVVQCNSHSDWFKALNLTSASLPYGTPKVLSDELTSNRLFAENHGMQVGLNRAFGFEEDLIRSVYKDELDVLGWDEPIGRMIPIEQPETAHDNNNRNNNKPINLALASLTQNVKSGTPAKKTEDLTKMVKMTQFKPVSITAHVQTFLHVLKVNEYLQVRDKIHRAEYQEKIEEMQAFIDQGQLDGLVQSSLENQSTTVATKKKPTGGGRKKKSQEPKLVGLCAKLISNTLSNVRKIVNSMIDDDTGGGRSHRKNIVEMLNKPGPGPPFTSRYPFQWEKLTPLTNEPLQPAEASTLEKNSKERSEYIRNSGFANLHQFSLNGLITQYRRFGFGPMTHVSMAHCLPYVRKRLVQIYLENDPKMVQTFEQQLKRFHQYGCQTFKKLKRSQFSTTERELLCLPNKKYDPLVETRDQDIIGELSVKCSEFVYRPWEPYPVTLHGRALLHSLQQHYPLPATSLLQSFDITPFSQIHSEKGPNSVGALLTSNRPLKTNQSDNNNNSRRLPNLPLNSYQELNEDLNSSELVPIPLSYLLPKNLTSIIDDLSQLLTKHEKSPNRETEQIMSTLPPSQRRLYQSIVDFCAEHRGSSSEMKGMGDIIALQTLVKEFEWLISPPCTLLPHAIGQDFVDNCNHLIMASVSPNHSIDYYRRPHKSQFNTQGREIFSKKYPPLSKPLPTQHIRLNTLFSPSYTDTSAQYNANSENIIKQNEVIKLIDKQQELLTRHIQIPTIPFLYQDRHRNVLRFMSQYAHEQLVGLIKTNKADASLIQAPSFQFEPTRYTVFSSESGPKNAPIPNILSSNVGQINSANYSTVGKIRELYDGITTNTPNPTKENRAHLIQTLIQQLMTQNPYSLSSLSFLTPPDMTESPSAFPLQTICPFTNSDLLIAVKTILQIYTHSTVSQLFYNVDQIVVGLFQAEQSQFSKVQPDIDVKKNTNAANKRKSKILTAVPVTIPSLSPPDLIINDSNHFFEQYIGVDNDSTTLIHTNSPIDVISEITLSSPGELTNPIEFSTLFPIQSLQTPAPQISTTFHILQRYHDKAPVSVDLNTNVSPQSLKLFAQSLLSFLDQLLPQKTSTTSSSSRKSQRGVTTSPAQPPISNLKSLPQLISAPIPLNLSSLDYEIALSQSVSKTILPAKLKAELIPLFRTYFGGGSLGKNASISSSTCQPTQKELKERDVKAAKTTMELLYPDELFDKTALLFFDREGHSFETLFYQLVVMSIKTMKNFGSSDKTLQTIGNSCDNNPKQLFSKLCYYYSYQNMILRQFQLNYNLKSLYFLTTQTFITNFGTFMNTQDTLLYWLRVVYDATVGLIDNVNINSKTPQKSKNKSDPTSQSSPTSHITFSMILPPHFIPLPSSSSTSPKPQQYQSMLSIFSLYLQSPLHSYPSFAHWYDDQYKSRQNDAEVSRVIYKPKVFEIKNQNGSKQRPLLIQYEVDSVLNISLPNDVDSQQYSSDSKEMNQLGTLVKFVLIIQDYLYSNDLNSDLIRINKQLHTLLNAIIHLSSFNQGQDNWNNNKKSEMALLKNISGIINQTTILLHHYKTILKGIIDLMKTMFTVRQEGCLDHQQKLASPPQSKAQTVQSLTHLRSLIDLFIQYLHHSTKGFYNRHHFGDEHPSSNLNHKKSRIKSVQNPFVITPNQDLPLYLVMYNNLCDIIQHVQGHYPLPIPKALNDTGFGENTKSNGQSQHVSDHLPELNNFGTLLRHLNLYHEEFQLHILQPMRAKIHDYSNLNSQNDTLCVLPVSSKMKDQLAHKFQKMQFTKPIKVNNSVAISSSKVYYYLHWLYQHVFPYLVSGQTNQNCRQTPKMRGKAMKKTMMELYVIIKIAIESINETESR